MRDPEAPIDDVREFATRVQRYVDGLAYEYEGINLHLVWETATEIIPPLLRALGERRL